MILPVWRQPCRRYLRPIFYDHRYVPKSTRSVVPAGFFVPGEGHQGHGILFFTTASRNIMSALCIDTVPRTMLRSFRAEVKPKASNARTTLRNEPERTVRRPCDSFSEFRIYRTSKSHLKMYESSFTYMYELFEQRIKTGLIFSLCFFLNKDTRAVVSRQFFSRFAYIVLFLWKER